MAARTNRTNLGCIIETAVPFFLSRGCKINTTSRLNCRNRCQKSGQDLRSIVSLEDNSQGELQIGSLAVFDEEVVHRNEGVLQGPPEVAEVRLPISISTG